MGGGYYLVCLHDVFKRWTIMTQFWFVYGLSPASPASSKIGPAGSATGSPKPFNPGLVPKQERTTGPGSILNLNLGQSCCMLVCITLCTFTIKVASDSWEFREG